MKDPAFLFYSSDFLVGVSDLTFEERGQYITLLCLHHQKGRLSKKAVAIAVGTATADVLDKFEMDENGLYYNKRLEYESEKRKAHSEKQRKRAVDGWATRRSHGNATALPLENENEIDNKKGESEGEEKMNIGIPSLKEFVAHAQIKKPNIDLFSVKAKYDTWVDDGWKDGNGKAIKNWKNKLMNTLPFLKEGKVGNLKMFTDQNFY